MKVRVFYKNTEVAPWIRENSSEKLSELERRLSELKKEIANNPKEVTKIEEIRKTKEQILALRREINRTKRFTEISDNKLIEGKLNIDTVSAANLLKINKEQEWFLSWSFLYKRTQDLEGNIYEESVEKNTIKEGDTLFVDFWRNSNANKRIWAGHMLPANINIVKITSNVNGKSFEQYWIRWTHNNLTGYYTPDGRYLPVYTGDIINIPKQDEVSKINEMRDLKVSEGSVEVLQERKVSEGSALEKFIWEINGLEKIERWFWISSFLIREAGRNEKYQDTLNKAIALWEQYVQNGHEKYAKVDIEEAIGRLKKTRELLGEKNLWLDIESYKAAIAKFESGAKWYFARNDGDAKKLWVDSDKYAYGKYQFIPMTLRGYTPILESYWITVSRPMTEDEIQSWLKNADAQEAVMDQYIIDMASSKILTDNKFSQEILNDPTKIAFYLALTHIGWPWALYNQDRVDYFNTPVSRYANMTWERYKTSIA